MRLNAASAAATTAGRGDASSDSDGGSGNTRGRTRTYRSSCALLLTAALLSLALPTPTSAASVQYGFQSGSIPSSSSGSSPSNPESTYGTESANDDTHAGSIYYSPTDHLMYVTGGTYGGYFNGGPTTQPEESHLPVSDCYVGVFRAPDVNRIDDSKSSSNAMGSNTDSGASPELLFTRRFGSSDVPDVCSAVAPVTLSAPPAADSDNVGEGGPHHLVVLGHSEEGGLMTDLRREGSDKSTAYGFCLDLELTTAVPGDASGRDSGVPQGARHVGGRLFHSSAVQYPVAVAVPPKFASSSATPSEDKSEVYIVLQTTDKATVNNRWDAKAHNPDLTAGGGGGIQKYGHGEFEVEIKKLGWKYEYGQSDSTFTASSATGGEISENMLTFYTQEYATVDRKSVRASTLKYVPHIGHDGNRADFLLLAGYTQGYGAAFGSLEPGTADSDGFLTKLDPKTGLEYKKVSDMTTAEANFGNTFSLRLATQDGRSEVIHGVCFEEGVDDVRDAFVVGSTTGVLAPGAMVADAKTREMFVVKVDLDTFNVEWRKQFGTAVAGKDAYATGCAVDPRGGIYVGGVVEDGGVLVGNDDPALPEEWQDGGLQSAGKDDVFLMRFKESGVLEWARQIGTAEDERLATAGGVAVDEDGDAVLFGTTRGSMMRMRGEEVPDPATGTVSKPSDAFVMSVSRSGHHRVPVEALAGGGGGFDPAAPPNDPTFPDQPAGSVPETPTTPIDEQQEVGMATQPSSNSKMSSSGIFGLALLASFLAVGLFFFAYRVGARRAEDSYHARHSNDHVTQYLKDFDDVDIALRQSATGGWHGMYDLGDDAIPLGGDSASGKVPQEVAFELGMGVSSLPGVSNADDTASLSRSSIATSSVVRENLFFDEDDDNIVGGLGGNRSAPNLSGGDGLFSIEDEDEQEGGEGGKWGAGYAGLVESYNESWDDRSPHSMGGALLPSPPSGGSGGGGSGSGGGGGGGYKDKPDDKEIV